MLLLTAVSAVALQAQTATGEINGTVTDPNGAAVPGAMVKLINQATKVEYELDGKFQRNGDRHSGGKDQRSGPGHHAPTDTIRHTVDVLMMLSKRCGERKRN